VINLFIIDIFYNMHTASIGACMMYAYMDMY